MNTLTTRPFNTLKPQDISTGYLNSDLAFFLLLDVLEKHSSKDLWPVAYLIMQQYYPREDIFDHYSNTCRNAWMHCKPQTARTERLLEMFGSFYATAMDWHGDDTGKVLTNQFLLDVAVDAMPSDKSMELGYRADAPMDLDVLTRYVIDQPNDALGDAFTDDERAEFSYLYRLSGALVAIMEFGANAMLNHHNDLDYSRIGDQLFYVMSRHAQHRNVMADIHDVGGSYAERLVRTAFHVLAWLNSSVGFPQYAEREDGGIFGPLFHPVVRMFSTIENRS